MNLWSAAWERVYKNRDFKDLTSTNFHKAGWLHNPKVLGDYWVEYLNQRCYDPDPRGSLKAREAVAGFYSDQGLGTSPGDVFITASTSEAYTLLFHLLGGPGKSLMLPQPGYPLFDQLALFSRSEILSYGLEPGTWALTRENLEAAWKPGAVILVLISPHNPTGRVWTRGELSLAFEFCREKNLVLLWDEVFDPWVQGEFPRPWEQEPETKVVILNGISKRFASPDLKLGWMVLRGPQAWKLDFCKDLEMANDSLLGCGSFPQYLLSGLFKNSGPLISMMQTQAMENRETVKRLLQPWAGKGMESGLYAVLDCSQSPWDDEHLALELLNRGLGVHPGFFYDLPGCYLVISLVSPPEEFAQKVQALASALNVLA